MITILPNKLIISISYDENISATQVPFNSKTSCTKLVIVDL